MQSPDSSETIASGPGQENARAGRGFGSVLHTLETWWRTDVTGTVDQVAVIEKRRSECALSARYLLMTSMSAGIAILGLLQGSAAVVIGAMLLSPLMDPIMGVGFALAIGDFQWLRQYAKSLGIGIAVAILFCALVVFLSPLQTITSEIAARTRPSLFDLGVAIFSSIAGAYAMIRGREGTIVGVAIATALMPPLAVVGYGAATLNWTVFSGALLLYVTNLLTIAITAWGMARLYGFRTTLSERNTLLQNLAIVSVVMALAIPLFISLQNIAWETNAQRIVRNELQDAFAANARIDQFDIDFATDPMMVDATVLTPRLNSGADDEVRAALRRRLGTDVDVIITQFQVGTSASAAEQAQLSAARAREEEAASRRAEDLAKRLAVVAGVAESDVTVDRQRRRAMVRARPLDGATLAAYRTLEARIAATEPDWRIELLPPVRPLPTIAFEQLPADENGEDAANDEDGAMAPTVAGTSALATVQWAAQRTGLPVSLSGERSIVALTRAHLERSGVTVREGTLTDSGTVVTPSWDEPDQ